MLSAGWRGSSRGLPIWAAIHRAVPGISWPMPIAPVGDTTAFCQPDSIHAMDLRRTSGTRHSRAADSKVGSRLTRLRDLRSATGRLRGPYNVTATVSTLPTGTTLGLEIPLAAA